MYSPWPEVDTALSTIIAGAVASSLETTTLDFKSEKTRSYGDTIKNVVEAVICFANTSGGYVVMGVDDKAAGKEAVLGTLLRTQDVKRRVYDMTDPPLVVEVVEIDIEGKVVLAVHVPASVDIHSDKQGRATRRIGTDCKPMSPKDQQRLREERQGLDWSAQPTALSVSDVDSDAMDEARKRLRAFADDRRDLAQLGDRDLLAALGVIDSDGHLLRAGQVLFCSSPGEPRIVYQHRLTSGGEPRAVERLEGPLVIAFQRVMDLVQARLELTPVTLRGGQQIQIEDFPELAVREALSNAVIHRDYHLDGPTTVEHSPSTFVVTSPGPLVAGVTLANILTHPSKPRNPTLAHAARVLGFAEELGRGVDRMYREMVRSGKQIPSIEESFNNVRVVLLGTSPNVHIARYVRQLPEHEQDDTDTMLILFTLCSTRLVSAEMLSKLLQRSVGETEVVLRRLSEDDVAMLEATKGTARLAHPMYRLQQEALRVLGTAVSYNKFTTTQSDRKVVAHIREYGKITNKTVQNILDLNIPQARAILADLVERELLVKTSGHQRGPGVEYGPGAKFPPAPAKRKRSAKESTDAGEQE